MKTIKRQKRRRELCRTFFFLAFFVAADSLSAQALQLNLHAHNVAYSSQTKKLYGSVDADDPNFGNDVVEIEPATGIIERAVYVGSGPNPLAISPDSPVAYVGLDANDQVCEIDLVSLTITASFAPGNSAYLGPFYAEQISVMPGHSGSIAVAMGSEGGEGVVAIFDQGTMRGAIDNTVPGANTIAFGSDPTTFYGFDNYDTGFGLSKYVVTSSGVALSIYASNVISSFGATISVDDKIIYATSGATVDGDNLQLAGTYQARGPIVIDDANAKVMIAQAQLVNVFDRDTFVPLYSVRVSESGGNPVSASGCGPGCIAIIYSSDQLFILPHVSETIFANGFE